MAMENEGNGQQQTILPSDNNPQPPQPPQQEPVKVEAQSNDNSVDSLPEWARESLSKANKEAASYRTQLREAQEALAKAKNPEDYEKVVANLAEAQHKLAIRDNTSGLPKELVEAPWVSWPQDEAGIKTVADQLRSLFAAQSAAKASPESGGELAGGLNPQSGSQADDLDPAVLARRFGRRR